jgi:hypothetical protein
MAYSASLAGMFCTRPGFCPAKFACVGYSATASDQPSATGLIQDMMGWTSDQMVRRYAEFVRRRIAAEPMPRYAPIWARRTRCGKRSSGVRNLATTWLGAPGGIRTHSLDLMRILLNRRAPGARANCAPKCTHPIGVEHRWPGRTIDAAWTYESGYLTPLFRAWRAT